MRTSMFRLAGVVGAAVFVLATSVTSVRGAPRPYKLGNRIADFRLPSDRGNQLALSQLRGKVVVLAFFSSWCPPCNDEAPVIEKHVWRAFRSRGVAVVGVDAGEIDRGASRPIAKFRRMHRLTYPLLADEPGQLLDRFGFEGFPELVVIDRDGRYYAHPKNVKAAIASVKKLLASQAYRPGKTVAKGAG